MAVTDVSGAQARTSGGDRAVRSAALSELAQHMLSKTSKKSSVPGILMLADGTVFYGRACGAQGTATGEVCFNTSLEGYFEVLTDPSYAGQIVTMTYPQIGNYGIDPVDTQTGLGADGDPTLNTRPALRGMIVHDMCRTPSNWRSTESVPAYLAERGIVALEASTRARSCGICATTAPRRASSPRRSLTSRSSRACSRRLPTWWARTSSRP